MAKPKVFLSSTYYDLRHVRERIGEYLTRFGFEPVLFEADNVYFAPNKSTDLSCYEEVKLCHMMVLIVSSRYGSPATNEEEKKDLHKEYNSITKSEYEAAKQTGMPIFVFIDKYVMAEYQTFKKNESYLKDNTAFNFAHVDDVNIFKFINILRTQPIKTFDKVEEIESYLSNQIAGMLFVHLKELKDKKTNSEIFNSIKELKNVSDNMNAMIDAVGKKILDNNDVYRQLISIQQKSTIMLFKDTFFTSVSIKTKKPLTDNACDNIADLFISALTNNDIIRKIDINSNKSDEYYSAIHEFCMYIFNEITSKFPNVTSIGFNNNIDNMLHMYISTVYNTITKSPELKDEMKKLFKNEIFQRFGKKA